MVAMREHRLSRIVLCLNAIVVSLVFVTTVNAQAIYRASVPPNGATLTKAPTQVIITFSTAMRATQSNGSVTDASGTVVSTGWSVDPTDGMTMTVTLQSTLGDGVSTVTYTAFSPEDDVGMKGAFIFTIASGTANGTTAVTATTGSGTPWSVVLAAFLAILAFVIGGLFILVRSHREHLAIEARQASPQPDEDEQ